MANTRIFIYCPFDKKSTELVDSSCIVCKKTKAELLSLIPPKIAEKSFKESYLERIEAARLKGKIKSSSSSLLKNIKGVKK